MRGRGGPQAKPRGRGTQRFPMNRFAAPSVSSGQFAMPPLPTMPEQQDQSSNIFNTDPSPQENSQSPEKQMIESGSADDSSFLLTPQSK